MNVKHCTLCPGETEYYCHSCQKELCQHCKATHVIDLNTKHHEVTFYREKFKYLPKHAICVMHSDKIYNKYCVPCEIPVCDSCFEHNPKRSPLLACFYPREDNKHIILRIRAAYEMKRQKSKEIIHNVCSETLYNSRALLKELKSDVDIFHREISRIKSEMKKRLEDDIDRVLLQAINKHEAEYRTWCLKQKNRIAQFLSMIQIYEHMYERSTYGHVKFLQFIKNTRLPRIQDTPFLTQHCRLSMTQEINMEGLFGLLNEPQITERGKRKLQAGNELQLILLPSPVLQKYIRVDGFDYCLHISCVTPDRVWVSDYYNKLILTDTTTGVKLYSVKDSLRYSGDGIHTVNNECELIYIDKDYNINKLSNDMKTKTTFIEKLNPPWLRWCVYCSPSSGDLLVGIYNYDTKIGEVRRYDNTRILKQTIPHKNTPHKLYEKPIYITENNNRDIVVSDWRRAVVVTNRRGRHRFSYEGPPSGSGLAPRGICTDALSHILICDANTATVQMINKDGDFLSYLLTTPSPGIPGRPLSLSYDVNSHVLFVGSGSSNTFSLFRYIERHRDLTGVECSCG